jgi:hypothetical protein
VKIKVIDAFGTHVGDAEVVWLAHSFAVLTSMDDEAETIFEPEITVILPTKDQRAPWRLEITP